MLNYLDLKKGVQFIFRDQPHEVIESKPMRKAQDVTVIQVTAKNLITGNVIEQSFHKDDKSEEAEIQKIEVKFIYCHKGKFIFSEAQDPSKRFELNHEQIGENSKYLKPNTVLTALIFKEKVINILLPIKMQLKVSEAPPGVKGDSAQGGTKAVVLETGATINAPLFIENDDVVEVNTQTGEYVRRVE